MRVIYPDQEIGIKDNEVSIFLAGPTPRDKETPSWRTEALEILEQLNFRGVVLVPERENWPDQSNYLDYLEQAEWEDRGLTRYPGIIVFWVPRDLNVLPGFTTNVEFGRFAIPENRHRIVYGRPDDAPKNRYLDWLYQRNIGELPHNDIESALKEAVRLANDLIEPVLA